MLLQDETLPNLSVRVIVKLKGEFSGIFPQVKGPDGLKATEESKQDVSLFKFIAAKVGLTMPKLSKLRLTEGLQEAEIVPGQAVIVTQYETKQVPVKPKLSSYTVKNQFPKGLSPKKSNGIEDDIDCAGDITDDNGKAEGKGAQV